MFRAEPLDYVWLAIAAFWLMFCVVDVALKKAWDTVDTTSLLIMGAYPLARYCFSTGMDAFTVTCILVAIMTVCVLLYLYRSGPEGIKKPGCWIWAALTVAAVFAIMYCYEIRQINTATFQQLTTEHADITRRATHILHNNLPYEEINAEATRYNEKVDAFYKQKRPVYAALLFDSAVDWNSLEYCWTIAPAEPQESSEPQESQEPQEEVLVPPIPPDHARPQHGQ